MNGHAMYDQRLDELKPLIGNAAKPVGPRAVSRKKKGPLVRFIEEDTNNVYVVTAPKEIVEEPFRPQLYRKNSGNLSKNMAADLVNQRGTQLITMPRSALRDSKKRARDAKVKLNEIRASEMVDMGIEGAQIKMPETAPTFSSNAHLRTDDYWDDLLGKRNRMYPCDFMTSSYFQFTVCVAIITNALLLNMEDFNTRSQEYTKHGIMVFSIVELLLILRRRNAGVLFASKEAGIFFICECVGVGGCVLDMWMISYLVDGWADTNVSALLRMLWLLRFVRLIQLVPQLHELFHGVSDALQGLFWVLIFMVLLLYAVAILCTRLIGHRKFEESESQSMDQMHHYFSHVSQTMITLFTIMTSGNLQPLVPAMECSPLVRMAFVMFYIFSGWTLQAVMTGTVSFHMMMSKTEIHSNDEEIEKDRKKRLNVMFEHIFAELDEDGNGALSHEEFKIMLQSKELLRTLASETQINVKDLEDLWGWLDTDGSDQVLIDDFMNAFMFLDQPLTQKPVFKMQERIASETVSLKSRLKSKVSDTFDALWEDMKSPIRTLEAMTEQTLILNATMGTLCERLGVPPGGYACSQQAIELTSPRTTSRIARLKSGRSLGSLELESQQTSNSLSEVEQKSAAQRIMATRLRAGSSTSIGGNERNSNSDSVRRTQSGLKQKPKSANMQDIEHRIAMQISDIENRIDKFRVRA